MKAMLASDYDPAKVRYPVGLQPKVDGVRALSPNGRFTGRSLEPFGNRYTNSFFSRPEYANLDGELAAQHECHADLCRLTTSATSTHEGEPWLLWWVFDWLAPGVIDCEYAERYRLLVDHVQRMQGSGLAGHLRVMPMVICNNEEELIVAHQNNLELGYEGSILRDLKGKHKQGRSTVREMGLLRIKDFIDFECVVTGIEEGRHNGNAAELDARGLTKRSTHQENMVPNGMVGNLRCRILKDVHDTTLKARPLLFKAGTEITVGPGRMPHDKRKEYFEHPERLLGDVIKAQMFPKGIKDKPRFPTYQSHRSKVDMSEG